MMYFILSIFIVIGFIITRIPTKALLERDARTGKAIYLKNLRDTNDEEKALLAAGKFYKFVGHTFVVLGALFISLIALT